MKVKYEDYYAEPIAPQEEVGCGYCWDKKKSTSKELFFLDAANNMRVCNYCPYCGRSYKEDVDAE